MQHTNSVTDEIGQGLVAALPWMLLGTHTLAAYTIPRVLHAPLPHSPARRISTSIMALLAHHRAACMPRMQRTSRPCVVVRSAQVESPTAATSTTSSVVSLSSDEYDEFIKDNELVLVDYYTE